MIVTKSLPAILMAAFFAWPQPSEASPQLLCLIHDNKKVECISFQTAIDVLADIERGIDAEDIFAAIERITPDYSIDLTHDVLGVCGQTTMISNDLAVEIDDPIGMSPSDFSLSDEDIQALVDECEISLSTLIGGSGGINIQQSVVATNDSFVEMSCGGDPTIMTPTAAGGSLVGIQNANPLPWIVYYYYRAVSAIVDSRNASADVFSGTAPQSDSSDYMNTYNAGKRVLEAQCAEGNQSACDTLASIEAGSEQDPEPPEPEPDPDPPSPPPPPPPPPPPEPEPEPEPDSTSLSDCLEGSCDNMCENITTWWDEFRAECEANGWSTYDCQKAALAADSCPADPTVILPTPDGDYVCHEPIDADAAFALFGDAWCEEQGKVATLSEHMQYSCAEFNDVEGFIESRWILICPQIIDDSGVCFGDGTPSGIPTGAIDENPFGSGFPEDGVPYVIQPGDTLSEISNRLLGSEAFWDELARANRIDNADLIFPGDELVVSVRPSTGYRNLAASSQVVPIIVSAGDTLTDLARTYLGSGERWQSIYEINRSEMLNGPSVLKAGQVILIPNNNR